MAEEVVERKGGVMRINAEEDAMNGNNGSVAKQMEQYHHD